MLLALAELVMPLLPVVPLDTLGRAIPLELRDSVPLCVTSGELFGFSASFQANVSTTEERRQGSGSASRLVLALCVYASLAGLDRTTRWRANIYPRKHPYLQTRRKGK
ncbi:hypothetical protein B0T16DRAFT_125670 [Cercophora newfieldiana]|uniref:Secreted protein n=1 Tax=Cercophora newfieldiana TaxID=92897 RepID=A0AA39YAL6_9PEZI|nr:hypothetical protein B0T16DRAFT_125670 [Cercophora newfieldiana]